MNWFMLRERGGGGGIYILRALQCQSNISNLGEIYTKAGIMIKFSINNMFE